MVLPLPALARKAEGSNAGFRLVAIIAFSARAAALQGLFKECRSKKAQCSLNVCSEQFAWIISSQCLWVRRFSTDMWNRPARFRRLDGPNTQHPTRRASAVVQIGYAG